jgi:hypothetical protein
MERVADPCERPAVLLRSEPFGATALDRPAHAEQAAVAHGIERGEMRNLRRRELDVADPTGDRRLRYPELLGDRPERHALLLTQPSRLEPLRRFHEHMFASIPDGSDEIPPGRVELPLVP